MYHSKSFKNYSKSNLYYLLLTIFCFLTAINYEILAFSFEKFAEQYHKQDNTHIKYSVLLTNGDVISGYITEVSIYDTLNDFNNSINDNTTPTNDNQINTNQKYKYNKKNQTNEQIFYVIIETSLGELIIYSDEIRKISALSDSYHPNHSLFIMPTANSIKNNHFISNYELAFFYVGFGISDLLSITGGRSILPFTTVDNQISMINAKLTLPSISIDASNFVFALGLNCGWVTTYNSMLHLYAIGTYNSIDLHNSNFSFGVFYKIGNQDYPSTIRLFDRIIAFDYPDGAFGICAGFDSRFSSRRDLSLVTEIWNSDITRPTNTAILLGLKLSSRNFSSTFGITLVTEPIVFPFFNFIWTPFN